MTHVVRRHWSQHVLKTTCVYASELHFIALDSRVDGGASISWKLFNIFRLLILVCTTALVSGCLTGCQSEWHCIPNAIPECGVIQKCSTCAQTSVHNSQLAHSSNCALAPKNACVERSLNSNLQHRLNIILQIGSFYRSEGLKTDLATTELAATINVWNTTPFWNGIALIARA